MSTKEDNKKAMIETVEDSIPDFAQMIKTTKEEMVIFHQDAFAADYQEQEFTLLGMAIKYAGLYGRKVTIISAE